MVNDLVNATYSPSSVVQSSLGAQDGEGISEIPTSGMETVYSGSQACPGCGGLMNPIQVLYGYGLCPDCQSLKNARAVKERMTHYA